MSYTPSLISKLDAANSTTAVTLEYIGSYSNVAAYASITVVVMSDIETNLVIYFSTSDTGPPSIQYTYSIPAGMLQTYSVPAFLKYYRVSCTPAGTPSQLLIQSRLHPSAVPATVNSNLSFSSATMTPVAQIDFSYGVSSDRVKYYVQGDGSLNPNQLLMNLDVSSNGRILMGSKASLPYKPGQTVLARFTAAFPYDNSSTTSRLIGLGGVWNLETDPATDGIFFGVINGVMSVVYRSVGNQHTINQALWNGDRMDGTASNKSTPVDVTLLNTYQIVYTPGFIYFYILSDDYVLVHTLRYSQLPAQNPSFGLYYEVVSSNSNTGIQIGPAAQFLEGPRVLGSSYSIDNTVSVNTTPLNGLTLQNQPGLQNRGLIHLRSLSVASLSGELLLPIQLVVDQPLDNPSFTNIDPTRSIASYDTSGFLVDSNGSTDSNYPRTVVFRGVGSELSDLDLTLYPGQRLTVVVASQNSSLVAATLNWVEEV